MSQSRPTSPTSLPSNVEAEQALIGAVLMMNELLHYVPEVLPQHFYEPLHQRIWEAIRRRRMRQEQANPVTLKAEFEQDEALADIGGAAYLAKLASYGAASYDVASLGREVVREHHRRQLVQACRDGMQEAFTKTDAEPEEVAARVVKAFEAIINNSRDETTLTTPQLCDIVVDKLAAKKKPQTTGIVCLDKAMDGGLIPGFCYGFAARKKVGKTILASTISHNLEKLGVKHLFVCGEMGAAEIYQRCLARELDEYPSHFRNEHTEGLCRKILNYRDTIKPFAVYQDVPGLTFDELRTYLPRAIYKHKITGFILDYWQLVGGKLRNQSTAEHLDEVAQWLANFCKRNKVWGIVMAQLNQDGNTRGSEGLRLACDQVYQIHREDMNSPGIWLEMLETRYTAWGNLGDKHTPAMWLNEKGPYFSERIYGG